MLNLVIVTCLPVSLSELLGKISLLLGAKRDFSVSPLHPRLILREGTQCRSLELPLSEEIPSYRSTGYSVLLIIVDQSCFIPRSSHL